MNADQTTLGRRAGSDAILSGIAEYCRERARKDDEATRGERPRHTEALKTFAQFIFPSNLMRHPLGYLLWRVAGQMGGTDHYNPGESQVSLFAQLGGDRPAPLPEVTFAELAAAAVDDFLGDFAGRVRALENELAEAQGKVDAAETLRTQAETDAAEVARLRGELAETEAKYAEASEQVVSLREMLGGKDSKPPRRRRVEGHTGVYLKPDGVTYEIGWMEDGKQRWQAIGPDLDEAIAARAAKTGEAGAA